MAAVHRRELCIGNVLERNVEVFADLGLRGHHFDHLVGESRGVGVVEAYPRDAVDAAQAAQQIGAQKAMKQVRNQINRHTNCDTANLGKTARANAQTLKAIRFLQEQKALETLPEVLQEAAAKRMENPDLSLAALCACFDPPVSKSGLSHRMKKLEALAQSMRERMEQEEQH